jgi:hypothetical protein
VKAVDLGQDGAELSANFVRVGLRPCSWCEHEAVLAPALRLAFDVLGLTMLDQGMNAAGQARFSQMSTRG